VQLKHINEYSSGPVKYNDFVAGYTMTGEAS